MDTRTLETFAQAARRQLLDQVSARLEQVLQTDSVELREQEESLNNLRKQIAQTSKEYVIEKAAYTWFNRFCALRFMDVNHYTRVGVVSPLPGFTQPEILADAKQGVIDPSFPVDGEQVAGLLSGQIPSSNPQQEAYRLLLVAACQAYHRVMPFLFDPIEDETQLLMPDDLLSENAVLQGIRDALTPETCQDVEVIGWLYQFYISEKKDEVIGSKGKIKAEEIPAATQLFTPHWIVRYLVENSLGRLWMLNNPTSKLVDQMDYYIQPEGEEDDFLRIESPEEIKVCDPACGSGHMLTYAFDLLYAIYAEQGYDPVRIPELILKNNLYGIEIDERAGDLAGFALMMKARQRDRRFFRRGVEPNICVLEDLHFRADELKQYKQAVGNDLFTQGLWMLLKQFEQAKNIGSLIRPAVKSPQQVRERLEELGVFGEMFLYNTNQKVKQALKQAEYLRQGYHVVVANPPYMGSRNMNVELKQFGKDHYPDSKKDLFAMFMERGFQLIQPNGYHAMVTMQSWMFLSSFEKLRKRLVTEKTLRCMVHMANMVMGIAFGTVATVWINDKKQNYKAHFSYVDYDDLTDEKTPHEFPIENDRLTIVANQDFKKIPGAPIAYWASDQERKSFEEGVNLGDLVEPRQGMATTDNKRFLRFWQEVSIEKASFGIGSLSEALASNGKWFPYNKGGSFRKWYGNNEYFVNYEDDGAELKAVVKEKYKDRDYAQGFTEERWDRLIEIWVLKNQQFYFKPSVTWTFVSSSNFGVRYSPKGFIFDVGGSSIFPKEREQYLFTAFLCSKLGMVQK